MTQQRRNLTRLDRIQSSGKSPRVLASSLRPGDDVNTWLAPVKDILNTPPGSPAVGDRYVVGCSPTGAWVGHESDIVEWDGAEWQFTDAVDGDTVWATGPSYFLTFQDLDADHPMVTLAGSSGSFWLPGHITDESHAIFPVQVIDQVATLPAADSVAMFATYLLNASPSAPYASLGDHLAISVCDPDDGRIWAFLSPVAGQLVWMVDENKFYVYNGTAYVPLEDTLTIYLDDLEDVDVTGRPDNSLLQYDSGTQTWEDITVQNLAGQVAQFLFLNDLADVDDTAASNGQWLRKITDTGASNDYQFDSITSDDVGNDSNVPGTTVTDALNNLDADITNIDGRVTTLEGAAAPTYALDDLTDVSTGSPGSGQDGYVVAWDNASGMYTLQAPAGGDLTSTNGACTHSIAELDIFAPSGFPYTVDTITMDDYSVYTIHVTCAYISKQSNSSVYGTPKTAIIGGSYQKIAGTVTQLTSDAYLVGTNAATSLWSTAVASGTGINIQVTPPASTDYVNAIACTHIAKISLTP